MAMVERDGPVTTVILDRPEARNAVDRATAEELAEAFRAFDADPEAGVGVLYGAGGTSARAPTKAFAAAELQPRRARGRRADGADAHAAHQAGDRSYRRLRRRRWAGAGAVVRPACDGGGRDARRFLSALGRPADRRRDGAPAAPDRALSRALD